MTKQTDGGRRECAARLPMMGHRSFCGRAIDGARRRNAYTSSLVRSLAGESPAPPTMLAEDAQGEGEHD